MESRNRKHQLIGDHYMANDQMEGVFAKAIDLLDSEIHHRR
jgi:hypothetical protein